MWRVETFRQENGEQNVDVLAVLCVFSRLFHCHLSLSCLRIVGAERLRVLHVDLEVVVYESFINITD